MFEGIGQQILAERKLKEEEEARIKAYGNPHDNPGESTEEKVQLTIYDKVWTLSPEDAKEAVQMLQDTYGLEDEEASEVVEAAIAAEEVDFGGKEEEVPAAAEEAAEMEEEDTEPEEEAAVDAVVEDSYFSDHLLQIASPDEGMSALAFDCLRDIITALSAEARTKIKADWDDYFENDPEYKDLQEGKVSDRLMAIREGMDKSLGGGEESGEEEMPEESHEEENPGSEY